ncbi:DUF3558 family protein [Nocardia niwae]|uniref:DUF3558 family protein n=1 Tax=Nocardia niwae TaxID=626084 RepID=A0ABV2X6A5_9NOCA
MTSRAIGRGLTAVACSAVMLLAGCETASSEKTSPTPGGTASATNTVAAPTTARAGGESAAPEPTRVEAGTPAPGTPAPDAPAPGAPAPDAPAPGTAPPGTPAPGSRAATPTDSPASPFWDPCTLRDSDLSAAGLDTSTKTRISDATFPTWQMCKWQSIDRTFQLVIAASDRTIADLLEPGTYQDLRRTEFAGRQVVQFRSVADTHKLGCEVGTPAAYGSIVFAVRNTRIQTDVGDPCADVNRVGAALFRSLP